MTLNPSIFHLGLQIEAIHSQYSKLKHTNNEREKNVPDVALSDENPSMVDRFRHPSFEDDGLKPPREEVLDSKRKDVIELVLALFEKTIPLHPTKQRLSFEDAPWVLLVEREELPGRVTDPTQDELDAPELALAPETVLSDELQLRVETLLLVWTTRLLEGLPI